MNIPLIDRRASLPFMFKLACAFIICVTPAAGQSEPPTQGKVILKSGGILKGKISSEKNPDNGRVHVKVLKEDGSLITLDRSRLVRKVELLSSKTIEYQQKAATVSSVDGHRAILEWCLDQPQGKRLFESEIELHANQILKSDPEDKQARKILGYERENGAWIQKDQFCGEHGYTRDGTSWTPIRSAQMKARQEEVDETISERKTALRKWLRAARRNELSRDDLTKSLFEFCDDYALPLVETAAKREQNPDVRAIMLEGIGRVPGNSAMRKLVNFAMNDADEFVRERALTLLGQSHYDAQVASRAFAEFFASKKNVNIQRAAHAIGELGGTSLISELIEVLVTTHTEKNPNALGPGRLNPTFTRDGGAGLATGGGPQTITITRQNDRVLNALRILTKQNLDFDVEQWREWNIKSNTHHSVSVRAD